MAIVEGVGPRLLGSLLEIGVLRRQLRGVYVAANAPDTLLLRAQALRLVVPEAAVVTDRTAGWLHGASRILAPNDHLAVPRVSMFSAVRGTRLRNQLTISGERGFKRGDVTVVHGVLVTTPLRTALDLGRLLHRDQAFAALDAMLRLGVFSSENLVEGVRRFRGYRGVRQLRGLAPLADGRSESPGESVLRLRWLDHPLLPRPEPQVPVVTRLGAFWLDLGVERLRFAAEYDGEEFHGPGEERHDEQRRELLREQDGWTIVVARRRDIFGRHQRVDEWLMSGYRDALARLPATGWTG
ncbi:MAG: hypothetical protein M3Z50_11850 [Actinomycetota bacterium]|nr:hypothetical protein [Actinomycetota bacterium]